MGEDFLIGLRNSPQDLSYLDKGVLLNDWLEGLNDNVMLKELCAKHLSRLAEMMELSLADRQGKPAEVAPIKQTHFTSSLWLLSRLPSTGN